MEVYKENIWGKWKRVDNGALYHFWDNGIVEIDHKYSMTYGIHTIKRRSSLMLGAKLFPFVVMHPGKYFVIQTKGGLVTLNYVNL